MAEYTNIETAMAIICDLCEDLYLDIFCPEKPNLGNNLGKCGRRKYLEEDADDVVPAVRCKDCKHFREYITVGTVCTKYVKSLSGREVGLRATGKDDFCSYGEREEND